MAPVRLVRFGGVELDHRSGELSRNGHKVRLPTQSLQILQVLLEHPGELVTRDELRERLWKADTFVDFDAGLNNAVKKLRDALEDSSEHPRFIETIPRRGYRLIVVPEVPEPAGQRRWGLVGVGVLTLIAIGVALSLGATRFASVRRPDSAPPSAIRSIVVLPFENRSGDPAQDSIADAIGEATTTYLQQMGTLRVIQWTSARQYKGTTKRPQDVMRELDADAAVSGSLTLAGDRLSVQAHLIRAPGDLLWAEAFKSEAGDIRAWQENTARAIAGGVYLQIRPDQPWRLARARPVNPEAYFAYLQGRFELSLRRADATQRAIKKFEEAIAKDPQYALAYSGLADAYYRLDLQGVSTPAEAMLKAERAARTALALDGSLAEAHTSLAAVLYRYYWDWGAAERHYRESIKIDPNYSEGRRSYGLYLQSVRRFEDSVEQHRLALDLSPLTLGPPFDQKRHVEYVAALFRAGRSKQAYEEVDRVRKAFSRPKFGAVDIGYELTYRQGDWLSAIRAFESVGTGGWINEWLAFAYAKADRTSDARAMLAALQQESTGRYVSPERFAIVHFGLDEREQGFQWLEKALDQRAMDLRQLTNGLFSFLHDDPKFQDVLRRMGLGDLKEFKTAPRNDVFPMSPE
jgi:DNA-binding winged helix-turn-helix (wHTH) protein/TolB-like protein/Tfp pilus assembly protein PilF